MIISGQKDSQEAEEAKEDSKSLVPQKALDERPQSKGPKDLKHIPGKLSITIEEIVNEIKQSIEGIENFDSARMYEYTAKELEEEERIIIQDSGTQMKSSNHNVMCSTPEQIPLWRHFPKDTIL